MKREKAQPPATRCFLLATAREINPISGIPQAFAAMGARVGIAAFGVTAAMLLTMSQILTTLVLLAAISGSAIHEAFIALIDMSMILSFVPLLGAIVAMVPPTTSANRLLFAVKVVGGCFMMISIGLIFYFHGVRGRAKIQGEVQ